MYVFLLWAKPPNFTQQQRLMLDPPHQLEPNFPKPQTCQGTVQFERWAKNYISKQLTWNDSSFCNILESLQYNILEFLQWNKIRRNKSYKAPVSSARQQYFLPDIHHGETNKKKFCVLMFNKQMTAAF